MKKLTALFILATLIIASCDQYPIFTDISKEQPPKEPKIPGSPSKMVKDAGSGRSGNLYVTNRKKIFRYDGSDWHSINGPSGYLIEPEIATINGEVSLVVAILGEGVKKIKLESSGETTGSWTAIGGRSDIQAIYAADGQLFGTAGTSGGAMSLKGDASGWEQVTGPSGTLNGVANLNGDYYYAMGSGVYKGTTSSATTLIEAGNFVSIIATGTTSGEIVALKGVPGDSNDEIVVITRSPVVRKEVKYDFPGHCAMTLANALTGETLILIPVDDRSLYYTHGYREVTVTGNTVDLGSFKEPGLNAPTTVSDRGTYQASLGKEPVTALMQHTNGRLFASTQKEGLWQYSGSWNAVD